MAITAMSITHDGNFTMSTFHYYIILILYIYNISIFYTSTLRYVHFSIYEGLNMSMSQYVNVLICQGLYSTYISMAHNVNVFINQERNTYALYIIVYCIVYSTIHNFKGSKKQLINQYMLDNLHRDSTGL